jgi:hypothetical protein
MEICRFVVYYALLHERACRNKDSTSSHNKFSIYEIHSDHMSCKSLFWLGVDHGIGFPELVISTSGICYQKSYYFLQMLVGLE